MKWTVYERNLPCPVGVARAMFPGARERLLPLGGNVEFSERLGGFIIERFVSYDLAVQQCMTCMKIH